MKTSALADERLTESELLDVPLLGAEGWLDVTLDDLVFSQAQGRLSLHCRTCAIETERMNVELLCKCTLEG